MSLGRCLRNWWRTLFLCRVFETWFVAWTSLRVPPATCADLAMVRVVRLLQPFWRPCGLWRQSRRLAAVAAAVVAAVAVAAVAALVLSACLVL